MKNAGDKQTRGTIHRGPPRSGGRRTPKRRSPVDRREYFPERRRYKRFQLNPGIFIAFNVPRLLGLLKQRRIKFAAVTDISAGGLSAQYAAEDMFSYNIDQLSLISESDDIQIEDIEFKTIHDTKTHHVQTGVHLRRCGIQFLKLTEDKKKGLSDLSQKYAVSDSTP